jgi:RNA polymerase sigma factor (sigma-70 family)
MAGRQLRAVVEFAHRVALPSADDEADEYLLRRFVGQGDEAAFALLLRRHGPMVLAVCRRVLGCRQDAENAFQATFLVLARRATANLCPRQLAGWLYGVAYRTALKARSLTARRQAPERPLSGTDWPAPADRAWHDVAAVLDEEISRLPPRYRSAFVLCYLQGKTTAEAGKELRCPRSTVLSRLAWARQRLRGRLTRRGVVPSAALAALLAEKARAALPEPLLQTARTAVQVLATSTGADGIATTPAAALAEGVLRSMLLDKCKTMAGVVLALVLAVVPVGVLGRPGAADKPRADESRLDPGTPKGWNLDFGELAEGRKNAPEDWVSFSSHEGDDAPTLEVVFADGGKPRSFPAVADAMVISYLTDRTWGRLPWMALDLRDCNRVLLRFDPKLDSKVKKAVLVLRFVKLPPEERRPDHWPARPFDVALHEVKEAWDEARVTWDSQPEFDKKSAATAEVDPKAKEVRVDVTKLVQRLADKDVPRHGWLLKAAVPVHAVNILRDGPPVEAALAKHLPWETSVARALERAREEKKLVLACARAGWRAEDSTFAERMLRMTALADPDVVALVRERFVPVRVSYSPAAYVQARERNLGSADPLAALGGKVQDAKGLALVVSEPDGSVVATLGNIGTFDRDLVLRLLVGALARPSPAEEKDPWKLLRRGDLAAAEKLFAALGGREGKYGLSRVASYRGDHAAALRLAEPLVSGEGPFRHEALVQSGQALLRLGHFGEAVKRLQDAAEGPAGPRSAEAGFDLGRLRFRAGEVDKARDAWRRVIDRHPGSLSAVTSRARLVWEDALAGYDNLTALGVDGLPAQTEVDRSRDEARCVERGIDYLLGQQGPEGYWSAAQSDSYRVAVTALAARSLHLWGGALQGERKRKAAGAVAQATAWLDAEVKTAEPRTFDSFGAAYLLDYLVDLEETKAPVRGDVKAAVRLLLAGQCPHGGWSYNFRFGVSWKGGVGGWPKTDKGREHSMNTGPALLALTRARALGYEVPAEALAEGRRALLGMREKAGSWTYTYPEPRNFTGPDQSIARAPVCEQALLRLGGGSKADLEATLALFMKYRRDLRSVAKLTESWLGPRCYSSYFYFFAYDHAARAIAEHKDGAKERLRELRDDLLRVVEVDGTWVDFDAIGKPYGTAMALHVLYLARQADR